MAKVAITQDYLQDIADAIRTKTGLSSTYYPSEMAQAILSISGSGGITPTGTINITSNGIKDVTRYASANVNVPNPSTGTLNITSNGNYNVTNYAIAAVAVPTGADINNQNKSVTPNQTQQIVTADSGYTGLGSVTVGAISSTYVGSGITTRNSNSLTVSGATVTAPAGYYASAASKAVATGTAGTPTATKGTVSSNQVTVTPSVTNTTGYITGSTKTGTGVVVKASQLVSGTLSVTSNGTKDVTNYASINVNVSGSSAPNLQDKTVSITPTTSNQSQTVTADSGYDGLDQVTINTAAVPTMTLPSSASSSASSGYTSKATIGRSTSNQYLNIPTGYNSTASYYTISATPNGSATAPSSISGTAAALSTGTNTLTLTKTVSVTPTVSAGYISAGTAGNSNVSLTASVTTKGAATITPGTTNQTIASGTYLTGTQTIAGDADLIAGNIKSGVSIFGVTGTYEGSGGGGGDTGELTVATATAQGTGTTYISFPVAGNPTSFVVIAESQLSVDATAKAAAVSFDGTNCYADMVTNTNNAQVTYSSYAYRQYNEGYVSIYLDALTFPSTVTYKLIYTYNGTSSDVHTAETQVGSGATSISFTGLVGQPTYWSIVFKSNFSTSSGYQRVIAAANDGSTICGLAMDSSAHPSTTYWSDSYNNGTLTISSQGTNAGGYFHQPGYYQLIYVTGAESETPSVTVVPLNVTTNGTYTAPSGTAYSPVTVTVSGSSGMNVQGYHGMAYARQNHLTETDVSLTVAKTGTYKVSWMGFRNTTSGTSSSQLYINDTAYGNANSTFTSSYGQSVTLTGVSLTAGQVVTVYARARSTSYYMYVGNLIIEQTA